MIGHQEGNMSQRQSKAIKEVLDVLESAEWSAEGADDMEDAKFFRRAALRLKEAFAVGK